MLHVHGYEDFTPHPFDKLRTGQTLPLKGEFVTGPLEQGGNVVELAG